MIKESLKTILPEHCIICSGEKIIQLTKDTSSSSQRIEFIVYPETIEQIKQLVLLANKINLKLYPISTGNNWGYGSCHPPQAGCILVVLEKLNKISLDENLSLLTIGPGVTQSDLYNYFKEHDFEYMVPTTGAGPNCSIVGNALERGYGITPIADHFAAVMGIEAILPNGEIYQSPLIANNMAPILKWGIGAYLDGIFSQSNMGIVTSMTLMVEKKPASVQMFVTYVSYGKLSKAISAIRTVLSQSKGNIGGINVMNANRISIMSDDYFLNTQKYSRESNWLIIGTIYGEKKHVKATRSLIKKAFHPITKKTFFITSQTAKFIQKLSYIIPCYFGKLKKSMLELPEIFGLFEGIPSHISLRLAYYKNRTKENVTDLEPARDQCGLLWYSPLIPMKSDEFEKYINFVYTVCSKYSIEPAITLTSLSSNAFDSTLPLIFTPHSPEEKVAYDCYHELLTTGRTLGFTPYRLHSAFMNTYFMSDAPHGKLTKQIKQIIDPNNIISPGRYE
ncbi:FAD-binding oxidoreductase [Snodgrassella gandavensis]|uniref:FAD-binding oxidoreductase n=1 Tax=Snodgrassella gandavensis TaxID=2946698 RepID=UPI001EF73864|nr:FAD-binding oxidoreductase [Snodgrassella gandavensis]